MIKIEALFVTVILAFLPPPVFAQTTESVDAEALRDFSELPFECLGPRISHLCSNYENTPAENRASSTHVLKVSCKDSCGNSYEFAMSDDITRKGKRWTAELTKSETDENRFDGEIVGTPVLTESHDRKKDRDGLSGLRAKRNALAEKTHSVWKSISVKIWLSYRQRAHQNYSETYDSVVYGDLYNQIEAKKETTKQYEAFSRDATMSLRVGHTLATTAKVGDSTEDSYYSDLCSNLDTFNSYLKYLVDDPRMTQYISTQDINLFSEFQKNSELQGLMTETKMASEEVERKEEEISKKLQKTETKTGSIEKTARCMDPVIEEGSSGAFSGPHLFEVLSQAFNEIEKRMPHLEAQTISTYNKLLAFVDVTDPYGPVQKTNGGPAQIDGMILDMEPLGGFKDFNIWTKDYLAERSKGTNLLSADGEVQKSFDFRDSCDDISTFRKSKKSKPLNVSTKVNLPSQKISEAQSDKQQDIQLLFFKGPEKISSKKIPVLAIVENSSAGPFGKIFVDGFMSTPQFYEETCLIFGNYCRDPIGQIEYIGAQTFIDIQDLRFYQNETALKTAKGAKFEVINVSHKDFVSRYSYYHYQWQRQIIEKAKGDH